MSTTIRKIINPANGTVLAELQFTSAQEAVEIIKKSKGDTVNLVMQRELVIWGKQGG